MAFLSAALLTVEAHPLAAQIIAGVVTGVSAAIASARQLARRSDRHDRRLQRLEALHGYQWNGENETEAANAVR